MDTDSAADGARASPGLALALGLAWPARSVSPMRTQRDRCSRDLGRRLVGIRVLSSNCRAVRPVGSLQRHLLRVRVQRCVARRVGHFGPCGLPRSGTRREDCVKPDACKTSSVVRSSPEPAPPACPCGELRASSARAPSRKLGWIRIAAGACVIVVVSILFTIAMFSEPRCRGSPQASAWFGEAIPKPDIVGRCGEGCAVGVAPKGACSRAWQPYCGNDCDIYGTIGRLLSGWR
jgi:hypothetical protein